MKKNISKDHLFFFILAIGTSCTFTLWSALINNYSVEVMNFIGKDIGILQSIREVPGLLAITALIFYFYKNKYFLFLV